MAADARRHAAAAPPRLPQPLARPDDLDARRRDRHRSPCRTRSTSSTASTALVGLLGLASLVPLLVVPLVGGAIADALDRRTVLLRTETGMAIVTGLFLVNALLPHPQVWALFVLQLGRGRRVQPRPSGDELARAAARSRRRDRSGRRARQRLQLARRGRPARRPAGLIIASAGVPWTYGDRLRHLRRVAPRALGAAEAAAARRRRARPSVALDHRRLPLPQGTAGAARDLRSSTRARWCSACRARSSRRSRCTGSAADAATVGYLYAAPYAGALVGSLVSGWTSHVRRQGLAVTICGVRVGRGDRRLRLHDVAVARARAARDRGRRRLLQRRAAQHDPAALDARPPARPSAGHRVHAGRERAEPRRRRSGRARVAHVASLLGRLRRRCSASPAAS